MTRGWKIGFAVAALGLSAALGGLVVFRVQAIEALARRELAALGLEEASLRVEAAGFNEARVADLRLGPEAHAEAVRLRYGLLPPRLARVEIDGLYLDASRPDQGVFSLLSGGQGGGGGLALPDIVLRNARIEADTPQGRAAASFSADLDSDGGRAEGAFEVAGLQAKGNFTAALDGPVGGSRYAVTLELTETVVAGQRLDKATGEGVLLIEEGGVALDGRIEAAGATALGPTTASLPFTARLGPERIALHVENGAAAAPERGLSVEGLTADLVREERIALSFAAKAVAVEGLAPFALEGKAGEAADGLSFEAKAKAAGATVAVRGKHDLASGKGQAQATLAALRFVPGGLQPASLVPALAAIDKASGSAGGEATLRWSPGQLRGAGTARFDGFSFEAAGVAIEGLTGAVRFVELTPPVTAPEQTLRAARISAGAPLEDLRLTFRLDGAARALEISRFSAGFAGGELVVANARIDPAAARNSLTLQVNDVDLGALLALVGVEGLTGQGRVSGVLPLTVLPDDVLVDDGEIAAVSPGVLRFRSEQAKQALASGGDYVELALQALEDFRYQTLSLSVDKAAGGRAVAKLSTLGSNPEVLDGHPFAINVTLNADANALLAQTLDVWRLSQGALATIVRGR